MSNNKSIIKQRYEWITRSFLPKTFVESVDDKRDYTTFTGEIDTDYSWIGDIKAATYKDVKRIAAQVKSETGKDVYLPAFFLSTPFGGDYDDSFAKLANKLYKPEKFNLWNEVWLSQNISGQDGSAKFLFDKNKLNITQNMFNIKQAKLEDYGEVARVYNDTINAGEYQDANAGDEELKNIMKKILNASTSSLDVRVMLAYSSLPDTYNELAGFYIAGTDGENAYLNDVGVMPKFQRNGLSTYLIKELLQYAKTMGADTLSLDTMSDKNIRYYKDKLGMEQFAITIQGEEKDERTM